MSAITSLDLTKPMQMRNGDKVRLLASDLKGEFNLVFALERNGKEQIISRVASGLNILGSSERDIINTPEIKRVYFIREKIKGRVVGVSGVASTEKYYDNLGYIDVDLSTLKPVVE